MTSPNDSLGYVKTYGGAGYAFVVNFSPWHRTEIL